MRIIIIFDQNMPDFEKIPENLESVCKWSVSVIVQKHRLGGMDFTSDIPTIIVRPGSRSIEN